MFKHVSMPTSAKRKLMKTSGGENGLAFGLSDTRSCDIWLTASSSCRVICENFGRLSPSCSQQRCTKFDSIANTSTDGGVSLELAGGAEGMGGRSPRLTTAPKMAESERPAHGR